MGNDFLPHLPTADLDDGGLQRLLTFYGQVRTELKSFLVDTHQGLFDISFLESIFQAFALHERAWLLKELKAPLSLHGTETGVAISVTNSSLVCVCVYF